jgi:hypothetical protein
MLYRFTFYALLLISFMAQAAESPFYSVELVIFQYTRSTDTESESWLLNPGFPKTEQATPLLASDSPKPYHLQPIDKLQPQLKKLQQQSAYRVLFHARWVQPPNIPVSLTGGKAVDPQLPNFSGRTEPFELTGVLTLTAPHALQLEADLLLQRPAAEKTPLPPTPMGEARHDIRLLAGTWTPKDTIQLQNFRLTSSLKMRTKEVYYLDHPAFGAIIWVERATASEKK